MGHRESNDLSTSRGHAALQLRNSLQLIGTWAELSQKPENTVAGTTFQFADPHSGGKWHMDLLFIFSEYHTMGRVVFFAYLFTVLFSVLAIATLPLSLAAFASLNPGAPGMVLLLEVAEGQVARLAGLADLGAFTRGILYVGLGVLCTALAAWIKPRKADG